MAMDLDQYDAEDVRIEIDNGYTTGACSDFLSEGVNHVIEYTERYLCEANAKELYDLACALENQAWRIRQKFEEWKSNNFQKPNPN